MTNKPKCSHCQHTINDDEMNAAAIDLWAIASNEDEADITCPRCDELYLCKGMAHDHGEGHYYIEFDKDLKKEKLTGVYTKCKWGGNNVFSVPEQHVRQFDDSSSRTRKKLNEKYNEKMRDKRSVEHYRRLKAVGDENGAVIRKLNSLSFTNS